MELVYEVTRKPLHHATGVSGVEGEHDHHGPRLHSVLPRAHFPHDARRKPALMEDARRPRCVLKPSSTIAPHAAARDGADRGAVTARARDPLYDEDGDAGEGRVT